MKKHKWFIMAAAAIAAQGFGVSSSAAQEFYPAFVSAVSISTNSSTGNLAYHFVGNRDLIRQCAAEMGVTNLMGLSLAYKRTADALDVVSGTNDTVVCTPITFSGGATLSNTNGTTAEQLTFVYWETNAVANGTMAATERMFTFTNGTSFFRLNGQLQFALPGNGTNGPVIYHGSLVAGSGFFERFDDNMPFVAPDRFHHRD